MTNDHQRQSFGELYTGYSERQTDIITLKSDFVPWKIYYGKELRWSQKNYRTPFKSLPSSVVHVPRDPRPTHSASLSRINNESVESPPCGSFTHVFVSFFHIISSFVRQYIEAKPISCGSFVVWCLIKVQLRQHLKFTDLFFKESQPFRIYHFNISHLICLQDF